MKKSLFIICISLLALSLSSQSQAKIYKWTDDKGVTHYSSTPPVQKSVKKKIKVKNIEDKIRAAAGKHRPTQSYGNNANASKKKTAKNKKTELAGPSKSLIGYCKTQRANLKNLKANFRNVWVDKDGKETILNQKQRQEKVNLIKNKISSDCKGV